MRNSGISQDDYWICHIMLMLKATIRNQTPGQTNEFKRGRRQALYTNECLDKFIDLVQGSFQHVVSKYLSSS